MIIKRYANYVKQLKGRPESKWWQLFLNPTAIPKLSRLS